MITKMRDMMKRKNGQKGFTLVELIVVMAILAVLAAIAVPRYTGILADSKAKADTANVQLLQNAVEVYYAQNSAYPTDLATLVTAGLLKAVPTQSTPTAGAPFVYTASTGTVSE